MSATSGQITHKAKVSVSPQKVFGESLVKHCSTLQLVDFTATVQTVSMSSFGGEQGNSPNVQLPELLFLIRFGSLGKSHGWLVLFPSSKRLFPSFFLSHALSSHSLRSCNRKQSPRLFIAGVLASRVGVIGLSTRVLGTS